MMGSMRAQILIPFHHEVHESSSWMGLTNRGGTPLLEGGRGCMGGTLSEIFKLQILIEF